MRCACASVPPCGRRAVTLDSGCCNSPQTPPPPRCRVLPAFHPRSQAEYAAFDPLFWLLHSMIDRCVWLFQNNARGTQGWVEAGALVQSEVGGLMLMASKGGGELRAALPPPCRLHVVLSRLRAQTQTPTIRLTHWATWSKWGTWATPTASPCHRPARSGGGCSPKAPTPCRTRCAGAGCRLRLAA
jgi:hypothetical protein